MAESTFKVKVKVLALREATFFFFELQILHIRNRFLPVNY
jgi:hypothetical protein